MSVSKVGHFLGKYRKDRKLLLATILVVILLAAGGYWYLASKSPNAPPQFFEARNRAGEISNRIVELTHTSVDNLELISAADEAGRYKRGLELTQEEIDRNAEVKNEAFKLSEELKIMALNLNEVRPKEAAEVGLQATTNGLELVQHLINYSNLTEELLGVLQTRLKSNGSPETRERIEQIILRMNQEAEAVNKLNDEYREEMKNFDRLTQ
ncbi:MAG: hypothetical protein HYY99_01000 [Candidatus Colwellbacteria bacterium]|nr:hypothetical protein [Candidatus Colwellbacteria bacterium]